ncbi:MULTISPECIES: hypothetical protein [Halobacterium]|uniref:Homolog to Sec-independent protein translocasesubunit TatA n=4 Tax=Halobacterium salinarum TaxID=2242 RepID=Q9HS88_HALSA|nr:MULTISPECIES: hypothetical protein [Halobacterium]AAG18920.1 hypothetical protein VNG_0352H [Halobacterium salinarum NRC-1]MBB6089752.1 membrane protein implicated in regulation of membrane protease activity [Halobacterium salinarum]MCF2164157.1 hypothetical protein [Halobacterium salinarum]MCF2167767.1 hypothetical protein [Halobacterium salinarum]MCF2239003.1 hypothetical protein [Halobacterium salinarum]
MVPPVFIGGVPSGMELAVMAFLLILIAAVAYGTVWVVRAVSDRGGSDLEARVEHLEGEVAALREDRRNREEP